MEVHALVTRFPYARSSLGREDSAWHLAHDLTLTDVMRCLSFTSWSQPRRSRGAFDEHHVTPRGERPTARWFGQPACLPCSPVDGILQQTRTIPERARKRCGARLIFLERSISRSGKSPLRCPVTRQAKARSARPLRGCSIGVDLAGEKRRKGVFFSIFLFLFSSDAGAG